MKNSQKGLTGIIILVIVVLVLLAAISYMYFKPSVQTQVSNSENTVSNNVSDTSSTNNSLKGISLNQLNNATYTVRDLVTMHGTQQVTLVNGNSANGSQMKATLGSQNAFYGDFNGDGVNDAIVLLDTTNDGAAAKELEMALILNGGVKTYYCAAANSLSNLSQFYVKNGSVIDGDKNDISAAGNLRQAYKFDGTKCVAGDVDITTGKANF